MKKSGTLLLLMVCMFSFYAFHIPDKPETGKSKVKWYSWEEAMTANKKEKRKLFLDIYTDWCGWCKKMDRSTFQKEKVARYLNENFYPVKLNAEMREDIIFNNHTFSYVKSGRRGMHMLAYSLLEGQMSYPSVVYLTEDFERIMISPGFKEPKDMMMELEFAAEEHFKMVDWQDFKDNQKKK